MNDEQRSGRPYRLRRGNALPWPKSPLPDWQAVEEPVPDVPEPGATPRFSEFASTLLREWPAGVTVAEWVAGRTVDWTGRQLDVAALRARFETLRSAGLLDHDPGIDRYVVPPAVQRWLDDPENEPLPGRT